MEITVKIAGSEYKLKADTPESEQYTRMAANEINATLAKYDARFADRSLADKLVFVALLETKQKLGYYAKLAELAQEVEKLKGETDDYLKSLKDI